MAYDSRPETHAHIAIVARLIGLVITELQRRAQLHDASKLEEPELTVANKFVPRLAEVQYGSEEYKALLTEMGVGLTHHYQHNRHHPEHFAGGISEMTLVDLIEMVCDWYAASLRHPADMRVGMIESIDLNRRRFGYGDELTSILKATVHSLGLA